MRFRLAREGYIDRPDEVGIVVEGGSNPDWSNLLYALKDSTERVPHMMPDLRIMVMSANAHLRGAEANEDFYK